MARFFGPGRRSDSRHGAGAALWIRSAHERLVDKSQEEWDEVFGDEVMAAALIDRLVHHCHLVTIRGNSYRMRQHTELWQTLHAAQEPEPASRRRRRQEVATV